MTYPINVLREELNNLNYPPINETYKEGKARHRYKKQLKKAIEILEGKQLELKFKL